MGSNRQFLIGLVGFELFILQTLILMFFFWCFRYRKVAYLDTDVGQTEFTPPGFLSLTIIDKIPAGMKINGLWHLNNFFICFL